MKIVTFNLRCCWKGNEDKQNSFVHRAGLIYEKIMHELPDVIAFQEVVPKSVELLKRMLPEYEFFGSMREENYTVEGLYTAFRKDKYALMSGDVFWLSPTPYVVASRFENQSGCARICVLTKLRNQQTQETFRVMNVHLDHISDEAQKLGLECIYEYIKRHDIVDKQPTVILGDFNATPASETIQSVYKQDWLFEATAKVVGTTYHGFGRVTDKKIDYIFITQEWKNRVVDAYLWTDESCGIYLSDHYPVCVEITDNKGE